MSDQNSSEYIDRVPEDYEKYVPGLDSESAIKETENYIRSMLKNAPPSAWEDLEEPCRKWAFAEYRMRQFLFKEIFENMQADETSHRIKNGEMTLSISLPDDSDVEDSMPLLKWSEVEKMQFPENPWRIYKVLPLAGFTFIAATSAGRKTWIAMEMANAITTPRPFLHENFFITEGCNVLYIDGEMALSEYQRRGKQLAFGDARKFEIHSLRDGAILNLYDDTCDDLDRIVRSVEAFDIGVVIIDTLRAVAGGLKEEKAEEVRAFFNRLKVLKDMGVSVIVLDHLRKKHPFEGKTPSMEQLFSSQDKAASSDLINMLKPDNDSNTIMFYQVKNRLGQTLKPFRIRMVDSTIPGQNDNRTTLQFDEWEQEDETLFEQAKAIVIALLENGDMKRKDLLAATEGLNVGGEKTVRRACKALEEAGLILSTKTGREISYCLKTPQNEDVEEENVDKSLF